MTPDPARLGAGNVPATQATDERVVILDPAARPVGELEKLAAHEAPGARHLAFSVVLEDRAGRWLMQRRSADKHHFAGMWANSCCSHPRPGEAITDAARRRLAYELGLEAPTSLQAVGAFWYRAIDPVSGLVEHEYDVVVKGILDTDVQLNPDPSEVSEVRWLTRASAFSLADQRTITAPWLSGVLGLAASGR